MAHQNLLRISSEITQLQQGGDLSISVAFRDSDIRSVKALVIGPPATPYEYGFFEFAIRFGPEYPNKPPLVDAKTTNGGRCRFNPNIYAGGKVCLSILGTWHGQKPGEEWTSAQGLESILWSIQSLMSNTPYENEPGYENAKSKEDKRMNEAYCAKIRHETLRIAVIQKLEEALRIQADGSIEVDHFAPDWSSSDDDDHDEPKRSPVEQENVDFYPFRDLYKRRLLWYYEHYIISIEHNKSKYKEGTAFEKMPFENGGNKMDGTFNYVELGKRIVRIREAIHKETAKWAIDGLVLKQRESSKAANLQRQYEQLAEHLKQRHTYNLSVGLEDTNPFVWIITYFGKPMTHLDGGIFRIRMCISPRFPQEQPRVKLETPIYHHRVSKDGILCYFPKKPEDMRNHVESIMEALEEESPPFDPRTIVHPEATSLLWGSENDKKRYYRQLRRSAQRSAEQD